MWINRNKRFREEERIYRKPSRIDLQELWCQIVNIFRKKCKKYKGSNY